MIQQNKQLPALKIRRAFTLIELLVVISVMVILMAIMIPAIKSLTRNNGQKQAVNLVTTMLANARSIAISQHRQVGVVFFEETAKYALPVNPNQTAMQLIIEDPNQSQYAHGVGNTVFIFQSTTRQYCPAGVQIATLNDDLAKQVMTGTGTGGQSRVILFDSNGQMRLRNGISRPDVGSAAPGKYPYAYGDWTVATKAGALGDGVSSPGLVIFSKKEYADFLSSNGAATDKQKADWIQQHADILIVNAYTGNVIR